MPLMPILAGGRMRLVNLPMGAGSRQIFDTDMENVRREMVAKRRMYYDGTQYDEENLTKLKELRADRLPEHLRLHAYSTQLSECIDFVTDQLSTGFHVVATDGVVQSVVDACIAASDTLSAEDDSQDIAIDDVLRDALIAGDVAVEARWDPIEGQVFLEFWDSEQVEFVYRTRSRLDRVVRTEVVWVTDEFGEQMQVLERVEYELFENVAGVPECRRATFWDANDDPREVEWLGIPELPWRLLRADAKRLRATRGESMITEQAMGTADRYNAVEQVSWLIARYNSHGNLVVVGDGSMLTSEKEGRLSKDVADVLTFPGGTSATSITLPTDPAMIEHQKGVLADHLYSAFGLTRIDQSTVTNLGGISGYALEILNRKTAGTFRRVQMNFARDVKSVFGLVLDMTAWHMAGVADVPEADVAVMAFWEVDPSAVFPNRELEVTMGSGYIVDSVMIRDDFVSGLISRDEALRQRGVREDDISQISGEIAADKPPAPEAGMFGGLQVVPTGTMAGSTISNATP